MHALIKELIDILDTALKVYTSLLEKCKAKNQALIERNLEKVEKITAEETALVPYITEAEDKRGAILTRISAEAGVPAEDITISKISSFIPADLKKEVFAKRDALRTLLDELKRYNEVNTQLIKQSLEIIELTFKTVGSAVNKEVTYNKRIADTAQKSKKRQKSILIDHKA